MDMAVANLLKHKIRLEFELEGNEEYEPYTYKRCRYYRSPTLQNVERVDAPLFKPFVLYTISKVLHEDRDIIIDEVSITVGVFGLEEREERGLVQYRFESPQDYPELFFTHSEVETQPFPEHLINQPFSVWVDVKCYFISDEFREALDRRYREAFNSDDESQDEDEVLPSPQIETYRQDRCVVCLESKPNILYLDCMHIAICDSCDRLKRTARVRKNCDVCRAEISKRIKI